MSDVRLSIDFGAQAWKSVFESGMKRKLQRGEFLWTQGMPLNRFFCLRSGIIRDFTTFPNGVEKTICFFKSPSFVGMPYLFNSGLEVAHSTMEAFTDCDLVSIDLKFMRKKLLTDPHLIYPISAELVAYSRFSMYCTEMFWADLPRRVAFLLYGMCDEYCLSPKIDGDKNAFCIRQEDIASVINASRPRVTSILSDFEERGYICLGRRYLKVLDLEALRFFAFEED